MNTLESKYKEIAEDLLIYFERPKQELIDNIVAALIKAESETWRRAAAACDKCMTHYEGKLGDPHGCLNGLAAEFYAMADGEGPSDL